MDAGGAADNDGFSSFLKEVGIKMETLDAGTPLRGMHKSFYSEMVRPDRKPSEASDFPGPTQSLLEDISESDFSAFEKMNLINSHVNSMITYEGQGEDDYSPLLTGADTMKLAKGDCDDQAYSKANLLKLAGFDEDKIHTVAVNCHYQLEDGRCTENEQHMLTIVEDEGNFYVLDGLSNDVQQLNGNLEAQGNTLIVGNENLGPGHLVISEVIAVAGLDGEYSKPANELYYSGIQPDVDECILSAQTGLSYSP